MIPMMFIKANPEWLLGPDDGVDEEKTKLSSQKLSYDPRPVLRAAVLPAEQALPSALALFSRSHRSGTDIPESCAGFRLQASFGAPRSPEAHNQEKPLCNEGWLGSSRD